MYKRGDVLYSRHVGTDRHGNKGPYMATDQPDRWMALGIVIVAVVGCAVPVGGATILLEAEGFDKLGGWVVDQQAMDQMGSPYVLAHGLGTPVADAVTTVKIPDPGTYRVWVRTRDWVAPWNAPGAPGRFQVTINGRPLNTVFGTEGAQWHWQPGGPVNLERGQTRLALCDLTGFDGRCDAIILSNDPAFEPPRDPHAMARFRRTQLGITGPINEGTFDLVVVGGGMAGTCAAISAARLGLNVALIQNRPVLGGNNSSEVRVHLNGQINLPPYPALGNVVRELDSGLRGNAQPAHHYDDARKLAVVRAEENLHLFLNTHVFKVEKTGDRITAVMARHIRRNTEHRFAAALFADCTGDGNLGYLAGAEYRMGREGRSQTGESLAPDKPDRMTMGTSVQWYAVETDQPVPFPECPWALQFTDETCYPMTRGDWDWETGMNRDQIAEIEFIRDYGLRVAFGNWAYLKNRYKFKQDYANHRLEWVAYIGGKRESRRLLGDVILQEQDILERRSYPDAMVTTTWTIDLHYPHPENSKQFPDAPFRSIARHKRIAPYPIPYRCLYSRNIENLFMAGRDISVTHVALGTVRVMRTGGMMGEVVGMAAAVARKHDTTPRGVYTRYLNELKALARRGVGRADSHETQATPPDGFDPTAPNVASRATVTASSVLDPDQYPPRCINDGRADTRNNNARWVSARGALPAWVEFTWDQPQTIATARIVSGWNDGSSPRPVDPIRDGIFQVHTPSGWQNVAGTRIQANTSFDLWLHFDPVTTQRLRLWITASPGDTARLWEVQLYAPSSN